LYKIQAKQFSQGGDEMVMKLDFKKTEKQLYAPSAKQFEILEVSPLHYLMIDGAGNPNTSQDYKDAVEALYAVSYTLKFMSKKTLNTDYAVLPLEGLWWSEDMATFVLDKKDEWLWTMMIRQPDHLSSEQVSAALAETRKKKDKDLPALKMLRFETLHEGLCIQIMHIGPYADEAPTIRRMHEYIHANGYVENGKHHEIYLSDPRKSAPEKMKTVLRQPMRRV
jgi:hypothetical protein